MVVNRNHHIFPFDVDDTLVMWDPSLCREVVLVTCPLTFMTYALGVNTPMIAMLKLKKKQGYHVRVWSASGLDWAEAVIKALHLEDYVDDVEAKPTSYADDTPASRWLKRVYIEPDDAWRNRSQR